MTNNYLEVVFILIPVHNRQATTLACLNILETNGDLARYNVVVIDDGSTDGTAEAIAQTYPSVKVLPGNGQLWWTGAIKQGMQYAYENGATHIVWLNDDTLPLAGTIPLLVQACSPDSRSIVAAQCYSSYDFNTPTYGGQLKKALSLQPIFVPAGDRKECDCISGNLVCIPRSAINAIGYPDPQRLPQSFADVVYTWRAKNAGYHLKVLGDAKAVCEQNPYEQGWLLDPNPIIKQWQRMVTPKSILYPPAYWNYCVNFYGLSAPIPFVRIYIKLLLISLARWIFSIELLKRFKPLINRKTANNS